MSTIDKWVNDITADIKLFANNISDEAEEIAVDVGKNAVKRLKTTGDYKDGPKKYRKSFRYSVERTNTGTELEVYSTKPQYTHLLEYGHVILNSGKKSRTKSGKSRYMARRGGTDRTQAFPHWRPAEDAAQKEFDKRIGELSEGVEG